MASNGIHQWLNVKYYQNIRKLTPMLIITVLIIVIIIILPFLVALQSMV